MAKALSGKVALVTGGSRGIGAAIAQRLAADGADVAFTYASGQVPADAVVREIEAGGRRGLALRADSGDAAAQEAARHMREGGRIVTIGSVNADRMPFAGGSVYAMTKAAVAGLVRGLARDLGPRGITVNNVQPGPVETDMNPASGAFADSLRALMAIPRYARGEEIAGLVAYLAGPEAAFVTGASLTIDGGFAT